MGADIDVRCRKTLSRHMAAAGQRGLQGIDHRLQRAVARHPLMLRLGFEAEHAVGGGRFQRAGGEEQPPVVGAPLGGRRRQTRIGKGIGQVGADGRAFGHHHVAVTDGRHLAHGIDGAIGVRLHRFTVLDHLYAIRLAHFLEHPADHASPRHGVGVEN